MNDKREQIRSWGRQVQVNDIVVIGEQPWRVIRLTTKQAVARRLVAEDTLEEPRYEKQAAIDRRFDRESGRMVKNPGERYSSGYAEFLGADETVQGLIDARAKAQAEQAAREKAVADERKSEAEAAETRKRNAGRAAEISFSEPLYIAGAGYNGQPTTGWMRTMKVATALGTPIMMMVKAERKQRWSFRDELEFEYSVEMAGFVPSFHEKTGRRQTSSFTCGGSAGALMDAICEWVGGEIEDIERDLAWRAENAKAETEKEVEQA
jgi:hypothetical protein